MEKDTIGIAFEILIDEIESIEEDLRIQAAEYVRAGDLTSAKQKIKTIEGIEPFINKITDLHEEWKSGLDTETKNPFKIEHINTPPRRAARTGLVVKLPNGTLIKEQTAAETFALTIKHIGLEKVAALKKVINNWPLISPEKHPTYSQQRINNVYIMTHTGTSAKKALLEEIANDLKIKLDISIAGS
jgi:hypothetical protein